MVYGCGNNCIKYLVIFFNVLVTLVGIAILATSLALAFSSTFKQYFVDIIDQASPDGTTAGSTFSTLQAIFYVTAAIGGLIFLTGFLGCCGAACESTCLLGFFFYDRPYFVFDRARNWHCCSCNAKSVSNIDKHLLYEHGN